MAEKGLLLEVSPEDVDIEFNHILAERGVSKKYEEFEAYKKEKLPLIVGYLSRGINRTVACYKAGISYYTFYLWQEKHDWIRDLVRSFEPMGISIAEDMLMGLVMKGELGAIVFKLCNQAPDRWRNIQKVEHSGEIKGTEMKIIAIVNQFKDGELIGYLRGTTDVKALHPEGGNQQILQVVDSVKTSA